MSAPTALEDLQRALAASEAGDAATAERLCRAVLEKHPDEWQALQLLGALRARQGAIDEAESLMRRALAVDEGPVVLANLALLLRRHGREQEALPLLERRAQLEPGSAAAWVSLARVLDKLDRLEEAEAAYERALQLDPTARHVLPELGNVLQRRGRPARAAEVFALDVARRPGQLAAWDQLGRAYDQLALQQAALPRDTDELPASAAQALDAFRRGAEAEPASPDGWNNLGVALAQFGRYDEAEAPYRRALTIAPHHREARMNLGQLLLLQGRFDEGWQLYGARHEVPAEGMVPPPDLPHWEGESLAGRSIVLWQEQGLGDCLQFVRYVTLLKALGASRVGVTCPPALARLLVTVPGVDEVRAQAGEQPAYDCWAYYLEVPMHLVTRLNTIPARLPYLFVDSKAVQEWSARLPSGGVRVGLVWKGSALHGNDGQRSLPGLATLAPLWQVPGVRFVSLQKGAGKDEAAQPPAGQPLFDAGAEVRDFADTAAVINNLDLVITVDTSVAHLAGALGRPVWVLLPAIQLDWRWLLDRDDSPWYPRVMRLFRQRRAGNWGPVIAEVASLLATFAAQAHCRLGTSLQAKGRNGKAEKHLRQALEIDPGQPQAATALGLLLLSQGRYEEGWRRFAARHRLRKPQHFPGAPGWPQWQGEPLAGRSILLWPEQGQGDSIQFVRYAAVLRQHGATRVTVACVKPLMELLRSAAGVDDVVAVGTELPVHDYWCQMLDVPQHTGTTLATIPARLPYLAVGKARRNKWARELPAQGLLVGLVWKGAAGHGNDASRSLPSLATLAPLWSVPGITFVSLQKDRAGDEVARLASTQPLIDLAPRLQDFTETGAILSRLDLLISVDTSPVHLAGALARPCWVLLPSPESDWRWLAGRDDSPWYPGVLRLFRQPRAGDWPAVIEAVAKALRLWAVDEGRERRR